MAKGTKRRENVGVTELLISIGKSQVGVITLLGNFDQNGGLNYVDSLG